MRRYNLLLAIVITKAVPAFLLILLIENNYIERYCNNNDNNNNRIYNNILDRQVGSPRGYLSRNRRAITWVSNYRCPI